MRALGGVVGALGGLGSHIVALRKSEPTLEDVFVELVGRGFDDESTDEDDAARRRPARRTTDRPARAADEPTDRPTDEPGSAKSSRR